LCHESIHADTAEARSVRNFRLRLLEIAQQYRLKVRRISHLRGAVAGRICRPVGISDKTDPGTMPGPAGCFFEVLSPAELSILLRLARAQDRFVKVVDLSRSVKACATISLSALAVHVHGLRRKLATKLSVAEWPAKFTEPWTAQTVSAAKRRLFQAGALPAAPRQAR
jgi:hypothetical protein